MRCGKRHQCRSNSKKFSLIEADLHNLYPSRTDVNKARSNYPFTVIRGEQRSFGSCDFEFDERARTAEPSPEARGRIARAMLYMSDEYDLYLKHKAGVAVTGRGTENIRLSRPSTGAMVVLSRLQGNQQSVY